MKDVTARPDSGPVQSRPARGAFAYGRSWPCPLKHSSLRPEADLVPQLVNNQCLFSKAPTMGSAQEVANFMAPVWFGPGEKFGTRRGSGPGSARDSFGLARICALLYSAYPQGGSVHFTFPLLDKKSPPIAMPTLLPECLWDVKCSDVFWSTNIEHDTLCLSGNACFIVNFDNSAESELLGTEWQGNRLGTILVKLCVAKVLS